MDLYTITQKYRDVLDKIEIDEETGEVLNCELIDSVESEFEEKVENVALYIKKIEAMEDAIKKEVDALCKRRKSLEKKSIRMREYLMNQMQSVDRGNFETARVKLRISQSESVEIIDENKLPLILMREELKFKPDKQAIREAIKSGQEIEGAVIAKKYNLSVK